MKRITILGSTGSIGRTALGLIAEHKDKFSVAGLTCQRNTELLISQIEKFKPDSVAVGGPEAAEEVRKRFPSLEVYYGQEGLCAVAAKDGADFVLSAIVGSAGLLPTLSAVKAGKTIGLANKETLVAAGEIVLREAAKSGSVIIPVDSEHSAVFQCLEGRNDRFLKKVILTASGGPFFGKTASELERVTPEEALNHPNWAMGKKITIDSATLMNKGLEVIEARHLFGIPAEKIDVLIHPQSIVHSIVEFKDGCQIAQMSVPDMRAAIAYALSYPERLDGVIPPLDLSSVGKLTFSEPDRESFPCLSYAYRALLEGGTMPAVMNAANEAAVEAFLERKIGFNGIPVIIKNTMDMHDGTKSPDIEAVLNADLWARQTAGGLIGRLGVKGGAVSLQ